MGSRPVNAGKSIHKGVETNLTFDFGTYFNWKTSVPLDVIYTRTEGRSNQYTYNLDAWIKGDTNPLVHKDSNGNWLPYVSKDIVTIAIGLINRAGFYARGEWQYFSKQFHDLQNSRTIYFYDSISTTAGNRQILDYLNIKSDATGLDGVIPAYELINLNLGYRKNNWSIFVNAKNILDRQYISTRLPEGIQPGLFRQVNFGFTLNL